MTTGLQGLGQRGGTPGPGEGGLAQLSAQTEREWAGASCGGGQAAEPRKKHALQRSYPGARPCASWTRPEGAPPRPRTSPGEARMRVSRR